MSFKGIVTRKEKDTGVTLLAKVVTENKKKSTKKEYKVRVIANGMSDREACNRDLTWMKNNFYEQGVSDLQGSLNFVPIGQYGTNITYNIINDSTDSPVTDYLDKNTGKLLGRPLFGSSDATGRIQITVSKGQESITGVVLVVIKSFSAFEVLNNSDMVNPASLWVAIANGDSPYYLSHGKVTLIQSWEPWKGTPLPPSSEPIIVSWQIDDALFESGLITQARASIGSNTIYCPEYTHVSRILQSGNSVGVNISEGISVSYSEYDKVLKMDGLRLKPTLKLGTETITFEAFNVFTSSSALTNEEVVTEIVANAETLSSGAGESTLFEIYNADNGLSLGGYIVSGVSTDEQNDTEQVTRIDASKVVGTTFTMRILSSQSLERVSLPKLLINRGKLAGTISNVAGASGPVFAFNGSDAYSINPITTQTIFSWTTRDENSKDTLLVIDLAALKDLVESGESDKVYFCVKQTLTVSKYDGTEKFTTISRQFAIDNIASVNTDGSGTDSGSTDGDEATNENE